MNNRQGRQQRNKKSRYRTAGRRWRRLPLLQIGTAVGIVVILFLLAVMIRGSSQQAEPNEVTAVTGGNVLERPDLEVELLTINDYSRPGIALNEVNGIVIHYTANPGTTAMNNRDYFEGLKDSGSAKVSSHFVIGLDGEIVQCIPSTEISYASNNRNWDTLSIECCHLDDTGAFTEATYDALVEMTAWLCQEFDVDTSGILRHYDITGKECPKYYVDHEDEWEQFLTDVETLRTGAK